MDKGMSLGELHPGPTPHSHIGEPDKDPCAHKGMTEMNRMRQSSSREKRSCSVARPADDGREILQFASGAKGKHVGSSSREQQPEFASRVGESETGGGSARAPVLVSELSWNWERSEAVGDHEKPRDIEARIELERDGRASGRRTAAGTSESDEVRAAQQGQMTMVKAERGGHVGEWGQREPSRERGRVTMRSILPGNRLAPIRYVYEEPRQRGRGDTRMGAHSYDTQPRVLHKQRHDLGERYEAVGSAHACVFRGCNPEHPAEAIKAFFDAKYKVEVQALRLSTDSRLSAEVK
ncbi:hypothetical protein K438DRAFT_1777959 [Mycena galopus ATCC 62051]|nr:hypothetical protein K438DRAFT_1777959 [Mycena galopus ATCC 62051]